MIGYLRGHIQRKQPNEVLLDVGGVGYRVHVPLSTFYRLGDAGADAVLFVHTHVREDALQLFGFATDQEQALFERLIDVSGVGPRLALGILSGIEASDLVTALRDGDLARLTRIPGVGKKTAERLVVELRDKMPAASAGPAAAAAPPALKDDVLSALANLGYPRPHAERALERALRQSPGARFEDLLRLTLQLVSAT